MAYNKTIAEAMSSRLRRLLDDKVHLPDQGRAGYARAIDDAVEQARSED